MIYRLITLCLLTAMLICPAALMSQNKQVMQAEYFWDADPGQGNGTSLTASDGTFDEAIEAVLTSTATLPAAGVHRLSVRVREYNGAWGPTFSTMIDVLPLSASSIRPIQVTTAEYFWDADPGQGNGNALLAFDSNFDSALEVVSGSLTNLPSIGVHKLSVRVRSGDNTWGPVFSTMVDVLSASSSSIRTVKVTAAEYFWDTDPGQGNGNTLLAFDGNFDEALEVVSGSLSSLPSVGVHKLNVRVRSGDNTWGPVFTTVVDVLATAPSSIRPITVTAAEYYWDTDPGQGNGNTLLAFDGNFDSALEVVTGALTSLPSVGVHKLNVRVRSGDNTWGPVFTTVVDVLATAPSSIRPIKVTAAEYYFDTDPGQGNGTAMLAQDGNFNSAIEVIIGGNIPSPVVAGVHVLYVRARDGSNTWGPSFGVVVNMDTTIGTFTAQINGPTTLCANQATGVIYTSPTSAGHTYAWSIVGGNIVSGAGTASITVNWNANGPYTLQLIECDNGATVCDTADITVTVNALAQTTLTQTICQGQSYLGYTTTGTYNTTYTGSNGCDSVRTVNLTVLPVATSTVTQSICQGQSYQGYTTTGVYRDTFPAANGCDSIRTLNLTVNAAITNNIAQTVCFGGNYLGYTATGTYRDTFSLPSGCDSIRVLNLTVRNQNTSTVNQTICQGQSYAGHSTAGTYIEHYTDQYGCDSTRTLNLTVSPAITNTVNQTVCFGGSYLGYTATGTYRDTFSLPSGCDSIRVLNLTVRAQNNTTVTTSICPGGNYYGHTTTGTYTDNFTDQYGCDSTRVLNLTVQAQITNTVNETICYGASYLGYTTTGTYRDTFANGGGCDSIRILNLTVRSQNTSTVNISICPGNSYHGYTTAGTYTDNFTDQYGCDSTRVLNLTVQSQNTTTVDTTICFGRAYEGYAATGVYRDTFAVGTGCDSIRVLTLVVRAQNTSLLNQTICSGDSFEGYSATGTYTDTLTDQFGCDSIRTLNLIVTPAIEHNTTISICEGDTFSGFTVSGIYRDTLVNGQGCDSIEVIDLTVNALPTLPIVTRTNNVLSVPATYTTYQWYQDGNLIAGASGSSVAVLSNGNYTVMVTNANGCAIESAVFVLTGVGIDDIANGWSVDYYPNPSSGIYYLDVKGTPSVDWSVYNSLGQLLQQGRGADSAPTEINLSLYADGVYYLKVQALGQVATHKLILTK